MLQRQGQDLLQTLRVHQSQFSLAVPSPAGKDFEKVGRWMNVPIEGKGREMDRWIKLDHY